jgi:F0F1-type ATP synthase membrane subunit b/b'
VPVLLHNFRHQTPYLRTSVSLIFLLSACLSLHAQQKTALPGAKKSRAKPVQTKTKPAKPGDELARLREEFIKATKDYQANLEKLRASYEKSVAKAEAELQKSQELFAAGLISKKTVEANELEVAQAKDKVADVDRRMASASTQIADTLLEAEAEAKLAKSKPIPRGALVRSAAMIRYNGGSSWVLSDAWQVQKFFQDTFKRPLPVAVFGQGSIHDRWRLDHHNSMDVSLHPDGPEGQALLGYLRAKGIPFLAFRQAIPGTATGPHIHVGRPSHRY